MDYLSIVWGLLILFLISLFIAIIIADKQQSKAQKKVMQLLPVLAKKNQKQYHMAIELLKEYPSEWDNILVFIEELCGKKDDSI